MFNEPEWCLKTFISKGTRCQESTGSARTRDCPLFPLTMCWAACRCTEISENQIRILTSAGTRAMCRCNTFPVYASMFCSSCVSSTRPFHFGKLFHTERTVYANNHPVWAASSILLQRLCHGVSWSLSVLAWWKQNDAKCMYAKGCESLLNPSSPQKGLIWFS